MLPLIEIKAHYNLAEALAAANQRDEAARHWRAGYQLCRQHDFDDQEADFLALGQALEILAVGVDDAAEANAGEVDVSLPAMIPLNEDEEAVLTLARREKTLTPKRLMQATNISRATATRRLTTLVEKGLLEKHGQGRGTIYRPVGGGASWTCCPRFQAHEVDWVAGRADPGLAPRQPSGTAPPLCHRCTRRALKPCGNALDARCGEV